MLMLPKFITTTRETPKILNKIHAHKRGNKAKDAKEKQKLIIMEYKRKKTIDDFDIFVQSLNYILILVVNYKLFSHLGGWGDWFWHCEAFATNAHTTLVFSLLLHLFPLLSFFTLHSNAIATCLPRVFTQTFGSFFFLFSFHNCSKDRAIAWRVRIWEANKEKEGFKEICLL